MNLPRRVSRRRLGRMPSLGGDFPAGLATRRNPQVGQSRGVRESLRLSVRRVAPLCLIVLLGWAVALGAGFSLGLTLLTSLGALAVLVGVWKPNLGFLGVSVMCALDGLSRNYLLTGGLLRWNTFSYLLALALLLKGGWLFRCRWLPVRSATVLLVILLVYLPISNDIPVGISHIVGFASVFGLIHYARRGFLDTARFCEAAFVTAFLTAAGGLVFLLRKNELAYINPNAYSFFPLTGLFAVSSVAPLLRLQTKWLLGMVLLAVTNAGLVYLTGSRGGFLLAVACLLCLVAALPSMRQRLALVGAGALIGAGLLLKFEAEREYVTHRLDKSFDSAEYGVTSRTSGRSDLVLVGWKIFLDHPLGVGTGSFANEYAVASVREGASFGVGVAKAAHACWIKMLTECGVLGFGVMVWFVSSFAVVGWRVRRSGSPLPGLLTTVVLATAFFTTEFHAKSLWYLCAVTTVILHWWRPGSAQRDFNRQKGGRVGGRLLLARAK